MNRTLKIGGATVNQTPIDWKNNVANIIEAIEAAKKEQVAILCLPELCLTGYGCEDLFLSNWLSAKAWQHLEMIIPHCNNITVNVGLPIRINNITYNGACVISNQKILGIALKQNLARDGVHYEPRWFDAWTPGVVKEIEIREQKINVGDLIFEVHGIKFGFEICEDAWRKEKRPGYRLCEQGVDLILNPSASHFAMGKSLLREKEVVIDGSLIFHCVYVFSNLLGNEAGRMIYDGDIIIGQHGKIVALNNRLSFKNFNLVSTEVNFDQPGLTKSLPLTDGKEKNEEMVRAASLGLYDYLRKSKAKGFVLSLSGGADSSLCAVLVSEMARRAISENGIEKFQHQLLLSEIKNSAEAIKQLLACAYQGTRNSSETTLTAAKELANSIGATFHQWNVDDEVEANKATIENALQRKLTWETDDIALQNIQARTRSPLIWLLANVKQCILLTTSNRSEGDVGYATMDGDTSGSLAPIAGLDKPFIIQWLKWAEKNLGYTGLSFVNNLQPTAELRPLERSQTDEKDLMPYTLLVAIEEQAIQWRKSPTEVYLELTKTIQDPLLKPYIKKFFKLWSINQWKRERIAPSFHLDEINVDPRSWCRFPILSGSFAEELAELDKL
ncbi:MAG: NAD(+) synthase [Chryseotalea sp. WA131a]|nr:MAG: NAD(+) synthase [Chryseotalea sp. WA131a]